jgi:hypothetical protein
MIESWVIDRLNPLKSEKLLILADPQRMIRAGARAVDGWAKENGLTVLFCSGNLALREMYGQEQTPIIWWIYSERGWGNRIDLLGARSTVHPSRRMKGRVSVRRVWPTAYKRAKSARDCALARAVKCAHILAKAKRAVTLSQPCGVRT